MDGAELRTDRGTGRIRGFDGLRALALVLVFLQHYTRIGAQLAMGGYGVWLFFVLSGFLIVRILAGERGRVEAGETTTGAALRRFFWRRTLRIFPPYYLALLVFTVLAVTHMVADFTWKAAPWHYAYLSNVYFGVIEGRWVGRFGHFWSLAIEEQFYLLAAPALLFAPGRWAKGICAAVVLAALTCDVVLRAGTASDMLLYTHSLTNFGALAFGGWLGLGLPGRSKLGTASWPGLAGLVMILVVIVGFQMLGPVQRGTSRMLSAAPFWSATLLSGLAIAGVYLNQASRLVSVLEWGWIAGFGRVSYGFYLYHNLLPRRIVTRLAAQAGQHWAVPEGVEALVSFSLGLALAVLSWKLMEQPLLKLKDRPWRIGWRRPAATAAVQG